MITMTVLNKELITRLNDLSSTNCELLTSFLTDLTKAQTEAEKRDATMKLNAKIRELVVKEGI